MRKVGIAFKCIYWPLFGGIPVYLRWESPLTSIHPVLIQENRTVPTRSLKHQTRRKSCVRQNTLLPQVKGLALGLSSGVAGGAAVVAATAEVLLTRWFGSIDYCSRPTNGCCVQPGWTAFVSVDREPPVCWPRLVQFTIVFSFITVHHLM